MLGPPLKNKQPIRARRSMSSLNKGVSDESSLAIIWVWAPVSDDVDVGATEFCATGNTHRCHLSVDRCGGLGGSGFQERAGARCGPDQQWHPGTRPAPDDYRRTT